MKTRGMIMYGDHPKLVHDEIKKMTRRVINPFNSEVGEGRVNWDSFDFYAQTFLSKELRAFMVKGAEPGSLADVSLKDNGRAPLPWADNSVSPFYESPHTWQYLHVPYRWAEDGTIYRIYPRYEVGDRFFVKQTWRVSNVNSPMSKGIVTIEFRAGNPGIQLTNNEFTYNEQGIYLPITYTATRTRNWQSAMFMPKSIASVWCEITEVRGERVKEITEEDVYREGLLFRKINQVYLCQNNGHYYDDVKMAFAELWDSLNSKRGYSFEVDPWVWGIGFKLIKKGEENENLHTNT